jgi:uncharacterized membrane protein YjfL (UPF0719 family)
MNEVSDPWFVRFPDGRVVRAANASVVRRQIHAGAIPRTSAVRRSPGEEWTSLEWTREFADLLEPPPADREPEPDENDRGPVHGETLRAPEAVESGGLSARLDPTRLPTIGVRVMMHELLAALDDTLFRKKLAVAALAGLLAGLVLAFVQLSPMEFESAAPWARYAAAGVLMLVIVTAAAGMLTRMTFRELSRMRPARLREGFAGLTGTTFRIAASLLLTAGVAGGLIAVLRLLPGWLITEPHIDPGFRETLATSATAVGMILEIFLWPIIGFALLLPPILVVEDCSVFRGLGQWLRLLNVDVGRVFVYEALALGLGLAATLLLALPWLILFTYQPDPSLATAVLFTRSVLAGLAAAPLLCYLIVANVFIYINLRYESAAGRRR